MPFGFVPFGFYIPSFFFYVFVFGFVSLFFFFFSLSFFSGLAPVHLLLFSLRRDSSGKYPALSKPNIHSQLATARHTFLTCPVFLLFFFFFYRRQP
ncbi:hypothetical protein B0I37DRAFT_77319 [Chaetomium sp. MPI-CAGE-AT-0009]|nr:hypothetical protein B0I37DRAFT_77319 [Chaetomium sp. MPI-CAGE-AT-0009]